MKLMRLAIAVAKTKYASVDGKPVLIYRANRWNLTPCWNQEVPSFKAHGKVMYMTGKTPIVEDIHGPFIKRAQDIARTIAGEDNDLDPRLGTESIFSEPPANTDPTQITPAIRQEIQEWVTRVYNTSDELDSEYNSKRGPYARNHSLYYKYVTSETYNKIQREVMLREFNKAVEREIKTNPGQPPNYTEITKTIAARFDAATTTIRKVRSDKPESEDKQETVRELKQTLKPTKSSLPVDITKDPRYQTIQKQVTAARNKRAQREREQDDQQPQPQPQPFSITDVFPLRYTGPSNGTYTQYEIINPLSYLPRPSAHTLTPCYPTTCRATLLPLNYKKDTPNELDSVRVWRGRKSEPLSPTNVTIMSKLAYHMIEQTLTEKMKQYIADNPRIEKAFQEWKQDVGE